jgi:hypothetical protein
MNGGTSADAEQSKVTTPFAVVAVPMQKAEDVYDIVLKSVGASLPKRDTLDERIIKNVKNRTGKLIDVQGGYPHGTPYDISKKAWPVLKSSPALKDGDYDGMPDAWERKIGLNPNDPKDSSFYKISKRYTNIEMYLNSLIMK